MFSYNRQTMSVLFHQRLLQPRNTYVNKRNNELLKEGECWMNQEFSWRFLAPSDMYRSCLRVCGIGRSIEEGPVVLPNLDPHRIADSQNLFQRWLWINTHPIHARSQSYSPNKQKSRRGTCLASPSTSSCIDLFPQRVPTTSSELGITSNRISVELGVEDGHTDTELLVSTSFLIHSVDKAGITRTLGQCDRITIRDSLAHPRSRWNGLPWCSFAWNTRNARWTEERG